MQSENLGARFQPRLFAAIPAEIIETIDGERRAASAACDQPTNPAGHWAQRRAELLALDAEETAARLPYAPQVKAAAERELARMERVGFEDVAAARGHRLTATALRFLDQQPERVGFEDVEAARACRLARASVVADDQSDVGQHLRQRRSFLSATGGLHAFLLGFRHLASRLGAAFKQPVDRHDVREDEVRQGALNGFDVREPGFKGSVQGNSPVGKMPGTEAGTGPGVQR